MPRGACREPSPGRAAIGRNFFPGTSSKEMEETVDFDQALRDYGPRIYTLAVRLTGNAADGQDLAQETFVKAYKNLNRFRGESDFGTWVYRICVNLWKNRVKYEKRRFFFRHFSLDSRGDPADPAPLDLPAQDPPMDKSLETQERQRIVQDALQRLDPEDRAVLVLRDMEDRSYEDIADLLGVPLGTVKSRLARSREKLKDRLKAYFAL
jgi:RNA polymerase sigma-70 factor, ECF subfamily